MLKAYSIQNLILLVFCLIMIEVLTTATLLFVGLGLLLILFKIKINKIIRNILAVGVFASYWLTYGKIIDPEVGLNFLVSIIVLKILEKENIRDRYMIFFGLLLVISAGSLFERSLTYVIFFGASFFLLIRDFYSTIGQRLRLKELGWAVMWVLPLTFLLFFFVPRLLNPLPFQQNTPSPGEIGYTPDVNISEIESLAGNQSPVFQVIVDRKLNYDSLYWRGNTLSYNDGWNWPHMLQDRDEGRKNIVLKEEVAQTTQIFRLYSRSDYYFALDVPSLVTVGMTTTALGSTRTLPQKRWEWVQRYQAISSARPLIELTPASYYLQSPLSKKEKENIRVQFAGEKLPQIIDSIRQHFLKNGFSYSLNPGKSASYFQFMQKKIGFCSHYASAVAIILRTKGIPTRLVSGFLGGSYNRFADFYLISQNDAHVWVEAFVEGQWIRLDPTEWIAPDRVRLGGEAFMAGVQNGTFRQVTFFKMPKIFFDFKQWFGQWDFHFYQWLEEMDYHSQEAWFSRFKFKRQWLFSVIPVIMVAFMLAYYWYLNRKTKQNIASEYQELWNRFFRKMKKRGLSLSTLSVSESQKMIKAYENAEVEKVWDELVSGSFKGDVFSKDIKKKIRKL